MDGSTADESSHLLGGEPRDAAADYATGPAQPSQDTEGKAEAQPLKADSLARANNRFVLWCTIVIISVVTAALAVAAVLSRSLALTADVVQNAVDLSTYVVNLYAEYETERMASAGKAGIRGKRLELFAACFSVAGLIGVGAYVLYAAIQRFHDSNSSNPDIDPGIDAHLLLAFTVFGCVADMLTLGLFMRYARAQRPSDGVGTGKNVNMVSATAHVVTDAIRSLTLLTGAFLIYLQHHDAIHLPVSEDVMDGYLSCFVVACMAVAALFVLKEIAGLLMSTSEEAGGVGFLCKPGSMLEEDMKKYQSDTSQENGDRRAAADGVRRRPTNSLSPGNEVVGDAV
eukprot:g2702.t1